MALLLFKCKTAVPEPPFEESYQGIAVRSIHPIEVPEDHPLAGEAVRRTAALRRIDSAIIAARPLIGRSFVGAAQRDFSSSDLKGSRIGFV
jgi:hypothetical protein